MKKRYARWKSRHLMKKYEQYAAKRYGSIEEAVLAHMTETDRMVYGYLSEPSVREIGRALNIPKSTVGDAIKRLRKAGFNTGRWSIG